MNYEEEELLKTVAHLQPGYSLGRAGFTDQECRVPDLH